VTLVGTGITPSQLGVWQAYKFPSGIWGMSKTGFVQFERMPVVTANVVFLTVETRRLANQTKAERCFSTQ